MDHMNVQTSLKTLNAIWGLVAPELPPKIDKGVLFHGTQIGYVEIPGAKDIKEDLQSRMKRIEHLEREKFSAFFVAIYACTPHHVYIVRKVGKKLKISCYEFYYGKGGELKFILQPPALHVKIATANGWCVVMRNCLWAP